MSQVLTANRSSITVFRNLKSTACLVARGRYLKPEHLSQIPPQYRPPSLRPDHWTPSFRITNIPDESYTHKLYKLILKHDRPIPIDPRIKEKFDPIKSKAIAAHSAFEELNDEFEKILHVPDETSIDLGTGPNLLEKEGTETVGPSKSEGGVILTKPEQIIIEWEFDYNQYIVNVEKQDLWPGFIKHESMKFRKKPHFARVASAHDSSNQIQKIS